jgi:transcriptional regulator with XRE-family HTH domain
VKPSFGENLQAFMKANGVNGAELARRLGVKGSTVTRWRNGRVPGAAELLAIAKVLGVEPVVLLGSDYVEPLPAEPPPPRGRPSARSGPPPPDSDVAVTRARRRTGS